VKDNGESGKRNMMGDLPRLAIGLAVTVIVSMIGLGIAQQAVDTQNFEPTDEFCSSKDTIVQAVDDAYGWFPMLILALIGGICIAYVARYMGWIQF